MTETKCLCDSALALADAATDVVATWEQGDLAAAVRNLDAAVKGFQTTYSKTAGCCSSVASPVAVEFNQRSRFRVALSIYRAGACDPSAVALAIVASCRAARQEGGCPAQDPAVRLMANQLGAICDLGEPRTDNQLVLECTRRGAVAIAE